MIMNDDEGFRGTRCRHSIAPSGFAQHHTVVWPAPRQVPVVIAQDARGVPVHWRGWGEGACILEHDFRKLHTHTFV